MRLPRDARSVMAWIGFPLALVVLALLFPEAFGLRSDASLSPLAPVSMLKDPKLKRTLKAHSDRGADEPEPELDPSLAEPGFGIRIRMSKAALGTIEGVTTDDAPHRDDIHDIDIGLGEAPPQRASLRLHGQGTRKRPKKSFRIDLFQPRPFTAGVSLTRFFLVGMVDDPGLFRTPFCYHVLRELGLFPVFTQLVTVYVNERPRGIHLLVERPRDALKRTEPGLVSVARRRSRDRLFAKYAGPVRNALGLIDRLSRAPDLDEAAQLPEYEEILDLEAYLTWLSFNSLVKYADSLDEVFFYEVRPHGDAYGRLTLMAWDYDEVMKPPVHPEEAVDDELMYACEARLDRFIQRNPVLYERFKRRLRSLLEETATPVYLEDTLARIKASLDAIDSGLPAQEQAAERATRSAQSELFRSQLLERRAELLKLLER